MQIGLQTQRTSEFGREQPSDGRLTCRVCPHACELMSDEFGICKVRQRQSDKIINPFEGRCSLISVEPIEKRPFFHYRPGKRYLAVGFYGCSFSCGFCQNFKVSQTIDGRYRYKSPDEIVELSQSKLAEGVAFTFNEPTLYYEYIRSVCELGVDVVVKTNGFVNKWVTDELSAVSAWNVDIKGDDLEYDRTCSGKLQPVLEIIPHLAESAHVEVSYLVLPRMLNDKSFHLRVRDFLSEINPDMPVHLLYFYPFHKMLEDRYDPTALLSVMRIFKERMNYIYVSNTFDSRLIMHRNTFCSKCNDLLIERVRSVHVSKTKCCGHELVQ